MGLGMSWEQELLCTSTSCCTGSVGVSGGIAPAAGDKCLQTEDAARPDLMLALLLAEVGPGTFQRN